MKKHWTIIEAGSLRMTKGQSYQDAVYELERGVREAVQKLVDNCERKKVKFQDDSFGSIQSDRDGAKSMYGDGKAPNQNYPDPSKCMWVRPRYTSHIHTLEEEMKDEDHSSDEEEEDETKGVDEEDPYGKESAERVFCERGELFKDGVNANDVIQGRLGDCWLLSAAGVLSTRADLLENVFWGSKDKKMESNMRKYGFRVCRFFKDAGWYYVIVDDSLPIFINTNKPCFAHSKDLNELWVCFLEKAYAKLHGAYDALIGGYIDGGLRDLTGLACEELVIRKGHMGFHPQNLIDLENGAMWKKIDEYCNQWGCMMGCSIQPDKNAGGGVEAAIGKTGLRMRHAYSLIDVGTIKTEIGPVSLVRLRNPWGFGEWTGPWSDGSAEFRKYKKQLDAEFSGPVCKRKNILSTAQVVEANEKDGTFFMSWDDFKKYFTVLFAGVDFPDEWSGYRIRGQWTKQNSGGNNTMKTWSINPKHRFKVLQNNTRVYFSLCQDDPRLTMGKNQAKAQDPIGFHIIRDDGTKFPLTPDPAVPGSKTNCAQASYKLHLSVDLDVKSMDKGDYIVVPSAYRKDTVGPYFMHIYSDKPMAVENGELIAEEEEDEGESAYPIEYFSNSVGDEDMAPSGEELETLNAFDEHRANLANELAKKGLEFAHVAQSFKGKVAIKWKDWQKGLKSLGVEPSRSAFDVFSGDDHTMDPNELKTLVDAQEEEKRIFNVSNNEAFNVSEGDESVPVEDDDARSNNSSTLVGAVKELQQENDELRDELDAMREEQARMMHVLLLYGKMLKCYDGPVHSAEDLLKKQPRRARRTQRLDISINSSNTIIQKPRKSSLSAYFEEPIEGDEFMAVKPWKGAIVAPTKVDTSNEDSTDSKTIDVDWVYGHGCSRGAMKSDPKSSKLIYYAAALGVVYDVNSNKQAWFKGEHNDDITCIDFDAEKSLAVTGQLGKKPFACVWNTDTCKLVTKLDKFDHQRAISQVGFSQDGSQVMTVGADDNHTIAVYASDSGKLVGSSKGSKEVCLFVTHDGTSFVTGGVKHITFWFNDDYNKKGKPGRFGKVGKLTLPCGSVSSTNGVVITGAQNGSIFVWKDREIAYTTDARVHGNQPVDTIAFDKASNTLISGGKDGNVITWTFKDNKLTQGQIVKKPGPIHSVTCNNVISLANGDVFANDKLVMSSHCSGELWGLDAAKEIAVSVGDDSYMKVWDTKTHKLVKSQKLPEPGRSVAFSPDNTLVAVGQSNNVVMILDAKTFETKATTKTLGGNKQQQQQAANGKKKAPARSRDSAQVTCIRFSPDGKLIAFGSNDTNVYVIDAGSLKKKAVLKSSSGTVTHLDWSGDSKYIRTNDGSYELLFYNVETKKQETSAKNLKDVQWATLSCPLSWEAQGVWPPDADGTDINAVARFQTKYIATTDDSGQVNLHPYPFPERDDAKVKCGLGHSSHVTNVAFLDEQTFITTGGNDKTVIQWSII